MTPPNDISSIANQKFKPNILKGLEDQSVPDSCTDFHWELIVASNPMPELKWFFNGEEITVTGSPDEPFEAFYERIPNAEHTFRFIFKLKEVFPEDAGFWMVFMNNECGTARSKATLDVKDVQGFGPGLITRPEEIYSSSLGSNTKITFKLDGEPVPNLTWSVNGCEHQPAQNLSNRYIETDIEMDDGIEFTLEIENVQQEDLGEWSVIMKNFHGEIEAGFLLRDPSLTQNRASNQANNGSPINHPISSINQSEFISGPEHSVTDLRLEAGPLVPRNGEALPREMPGSSRDDRLKTSYDPIDHIMEEHALRSQDEGSNLIDVGDEEDHDYFQEQQARDAEPLQPPPKTINVGQIAKKKNTPPITHQSRTQGVSSPSSSARSPEPVQIQQEQNDQNRQRHIAGPDQIENPNQQNHQSEEQSDTETPTQTETVDDSLADQLANINMTNLRKSGANGPQHNQQMQQQHQQQQQEEYEMEMQRRHQQALREQHQALQEQQAQQQAQHPQQFREQIDQSSDYTSTADIVDGQREQQGGTERVLKRKFFWSRQKIVSDQKFGGIFDTLPLSPKKQKSTS